MSSLIRIWVSIILLALCLALPARAASLNQGVFEVRLKDHREAIGDFANLTVTVGDILISPKPRLIFWQSGWKSLNVAPETVDLTKYLGKSSALIYRASLNSGSFDGIHLKLKEIRGVLRKGPPATPIKDTIGPIRLAFEISAESATLIVLDLVVVDMSDHPPRGYELAIRGYELFNNGKLIDKVPPGP